MNHKHFANVAEYARWARFALGGTKRHYITDHWPERVPAGIDTLTNGRDDLVSRAESVMDKLAAELPETVRPMWESSVAGAFANVPAFLMGRPDSMWRMNRVAREDAPIRIWIGVSSSYGIDEDKLLERGIALMAFAMAMSETRTVLLTPYWCGQTDKHIGDEHCVSWDLQTSPFVLSELAASLADANVTRYLGLFAGNVLSGCGVTGWRHVPHVNRHDDEASMRARLGCADEDIWLGPIHLYDPLLTDPVAWIKDKLAQYQ